MFSICAELAGGHKGLTCSWVAVQGAPKQGVLDFLQVSETGTEVIPGEYDASMCCRELPDGWFVVVHLDFGWADSERIRSLSAFGPTVGCQVSENYGGSASRGAAAGEELWSVLHLDEDDEETIVKGEPPEAWAAVYQTLRRKQDESDAANAQVDLMFDAPLELAKAVCGYRVDDFEPPFTLLEGPGAPKVAQKPKGLFAKLFGG
jgi:hypothetical protein